MITVLAVASEMHPLVKTGGLADVVGALPAALGTHGVSVTTLLPGYPAVMRALAGAGVAASIEDCFGGPATLRRGGLDGVDLLALDAPHLFDRPGNPYAGPDGKDWPDNPVRFAALSYVAAEIARGLVPGFAPDILHAHDWQAALAPAYLAYAAGPRPRTVMTVHNLAFQGQYPAGMLSALRLPPHAFDANGVEYYGMIGFLKAGLFFADRITTVSPRYAAEIRTAEAGMGLQGLLAARADVLSGIVNGIDEAEWNPAADLRLAVTYDARSLPKRAENRALLEARFGLDRDSSPLFCVVSRLTWQKGMDLLADALPAIVASGARLALLGSGDRELEAAFIVAAAAHPGRVGVILGYDEALSHQIFGGGDAIVIPSRFEPCGLTQLYGLRYGCIPVVARVGGLSDTIVDANDAALTLKAATGVQFQPVTGPMLADAVTRAADLFADKPAWHAMQRRGMGLDLSWTSRAGAYARLFAGLVDAARPARSIT
jgi:starch synthase